MSNTHSADSAFNYRPHPDQTIKPNHRSRLNLPTIHRVRFSCKSITDIRNESPSASSFKQREKLHMAKESLPINQLIRYQLDEFNQHSRFRKDRYSIGRKLFGLNSIRAIFNRFSTRTVPTIVIGDSACSLVIFFFFSSIISFLRYCNRKIQRVRDRFVVSDHYRPSFPFTVDITGLTRLYAPVNPFSALFGDAMTQYAVSMEQLRYMRPARRRDLRLRGINAKRELWKMEHEGGGDSRNCRSRFTYVSRLAEAFRRRVVSL